MILAWVLLGRRLPGWPCSQVRRVVAEGYLVGVLCSVVQVPVLGDLIDEHEEDEAEHDALPEGGGEHVEGLVVDPVELLQALQVIDPTRTVSDSPQAQVVHMAQHGPAVLERDSLTLLLVLDKFILEIGLSDVVCVPDGLTGLLEVALENIQLIAHL